MTSEDRNNTTPPTPPVDFTELYFTCPECGGTNLWLRQEALLAVLCVLSDGQVECDNAYPDKDLGYECRNCHYVLSHQTGDRVCGRDIVDWLMSNCDQAN